MKFLITLCIITIILFNNAAKAKEAETYEPYYPKEYAGYIEYEKITDNGKKISVRKPVKYKLHLEGLYEDNDMGYEYRDYKVEINRLKKEQEAKEMEDSEKNKINSAENYPIYFHE